MTFFIYEIFLMQKRWNDRSDRTVDRMLDFVGLEKAAVGTKFCTIQAPR